MVASAFKRDRSIYKLNPYQVLLRILLTLWQVPAQQKLWNNVVLN
jgi:hypothetical protein